MARYEHGNGEEEKSVLPPNDLAHNHHSEEFVAKSFQERVLLQPDCVTAGIEFRGRERMGISRMALLPTKDLDQCVRNRLLSPKNHLTRWQIAEEQAMVRPLQRSARERAIQAQQDFRKALDVAPYVPLKDRFPPAWHENMARERALAERDPASMSYRGHSEQNRVVGHAHKVRNASIYRQQAYRQAVEG